MTKAVKEAYGIHVIERLPKSMYSMRVEHLSIEPSTGAIEAHIE